MYSQGCTEGADFLMKIVMMMIKLMRMRMTMMMKMLRMRMAMMMTMVLLSMMIKGMHRFCRFAKFSN